MSAALHVATWEPATSTRDGVVLFLHGAESHSGWFEEVGRLVAQGGLRAFAYDREGWGKSPGRRGNVQNMDQVLGEVVAEARRLGAPVHLAGLSWGGLLAAAAVAKFPELFRTMTLIAPSLFRSKTPTALGLIRSGLGLGQVKLPIKPEDFTRHPDRLAYVKGDRLRVEAVNFGFCMATLGLEKIARGLKPAIKTRILLAETDDLIDNERTRQWAKSRDVAVRTIPGTLHSLVLEAPDAVAREILDVTRAL